MINTKKLKGRMVERGITQEDLANRMKLSRSRINAKLNNENGEIVSLKEAEEIIEILKIDNPLEYFFYTKVADTKQQGGGK